VTTPAGDEGAEAAGGEGAEVAGGEGAEVAGGEGAEVAGDPGGIGDRMPPQLRAERLARRSTEVRPPTLSEVVLRELREDLIKGRFEPGDPVRVDQVAAEFGVSALPVREALRVLLAEGRVQYASHKGYRVTALTMADVEEIFLMCGVLEGEAVRRGVPRLDDAGIARMRDLLAQLQSPPETASVWDIATIHQDFHFVPMEYAGLPRMQAELRRLWDHTDHYRALYLFGDADLMELMNTEHREIAAACAERDAERVVALMDAHRKHALSHLAVHVTEPAAPAPRSVRGARS
jgi:DNA-binding GntR family transcriptional regulator